MSRQTKSPTRVPRRLHPPVGLVPYMATSEADYEGCAVLVFANTRREARSLGHAALCDFCDCEWTDLRVRRLKAEPHIMKQAVSTEPHVVDDPETCPSCERWGGRLLENGRCTNCSEAEDEEANTSFQGTANL